MEELIKVLQDINHSLIGIRASLGAIGLYLFFMLCFKDMGNGAKDAIHNLENKITNLFKKF